MERQIKSKARVTDFGEVYTAKKQVVDMVDLVDQAISEIGATVLEPACGNGNFLVEILERKIKAAINTNNFEKNLLLAVSSVYGVDIQKDNVQECRGRLYKKILKYFPYPTAEFEKILRFVLSKNIMCANTLTMLDNKGRPMVVSEWEVRDNGTVVRKEVLFSDMVDNGGESTHNIHTYYYRWKSEESRLTA